MYDFLVYRSIDLLNTVSLYNKQEPITDKQLLRSEEHTSELQSRGHLVCRLLLEKKKKKTEETET